MWLHICNSFGRSLRAGCKLFYCMYAMHSMHVCVYAMYVCMYVSMCMYVCMFCMYLCMYVCMYVFMCVRNVCIYIYTKILGHMWLSPLGIMWQFLCLSETNHKNTGIYSHVGLANAPNCHIIPAGLSYIYIWICVYVYVYIWHSRGTGLLMPKFVLPLHSPNPSAPPPRSGKRKAKRI